MLARDFAYWLQGFFEIVSADGHEINLTSNQTKMIQKHLELVFIHDIDPSQGDAQHQKLLNEVHNKLPAYMDPKIPNSAFPNGRPRC